MEDPQSMTFSEDSGPLYAQTASEPGLPDEIPSSPAPSAKIPQSIWKDNNLDSKLLEFLCFLGEHDVEVVEKAVLHRENGAGLGEGKSMEAFPASWEGRPVILKCLRVDRVPEINGGEGEGEEYDKLLTSYKRLQKDLLFEIQVMARRPLNEHRNIVKLLAVSFEEVLLTPQRSSKDDDKMEDEVFLPILIVEPALTKHPTLSDYFRVNRGQKLPLDLASSLISDVADGLSAIHLYGIVHGDVKDENILLFEELIKGESRVVAKIADFGSSGLEPSREDVRGRSYYWAAPELLERPNGWEGLRITSAADIYSFGLLAATIYLNGRRPFSPDADTRALKMKDEALKNVEGVLEEKIHDSLQCLEEEKNSALLVLRHILHGTLRLKVKDRWESLSKVRRLLQTWTDFEDLKQMHSMVPFRSYGTEAHPGIERIAPKVSERIYHRLPNVMKRRLAFHISRFRDASKDSQTLLIYLALEMREDPSILEASDGVIRQLLALRLSHSAPAAESVQQEVDLKDLGGFGAMFLREVMINQTEEPRLLKLVREGKLEDAKALVFEHAEHRLVTIGSNWNGLHYAAYFDRPHFIDLFLEGPHALEVNAIGGIIHRYTPLHEAARAANAQCVRQLLNHGAAVDRRSMTAGEFNMTPLQLLISVQKTCDPRKVSEIADMLLAAGSSPNFRYQGLGIAHIAAQENASLLKVILQHNPALAHQLTPNRQTPLHSAAGTRNLEAVILLLSYGAAVNAENVAGDTPLHNAYMSIGPSTKLTSVRYDDRFAQKLVGSVEDAEELIRVLIDAGADVDALGIRDLPWDTPEFRQYDEYEDASLISISPTKLLIEGGGEATASGWRNICDWNQSEFNICAVYHSLKPKIDFCYDFKEVIPNYYQLMVRVGVLYHPILTFSLTLLVFRCPKPDTAEVLVASRIPLGQLEINRAYSIKLRGFSVAHKEDLRIHVYSENSAGAAIDVTEGHLLLDWIKVVKFDVFTAVGHSTSTEIEKLEQLN